MTADAQVALPLARVLDLSRGRCVPSHSALPASIDPCTDTRTIVPGQVYVAIVGERFDGHAFVAQARERGAVAAIISDESALPPGFPGIVVENTTQAYLDCAQVARELLSGRVLAITGSVGKTTTKEFCRALCEAADLGPVSATPANENNEIGVGHLMLRVLRTTPPAQTLIVEMGARHVGEIALLCRAARPDVGILTGVGESHLENFPSREALEETKWGLFAFAARPVLNAGDAASLARLDSVLERTPILCSASPMSSDMRETHARVKDTHIATMEVVAASDEIEVRFAERTYRGRFPIPGAHHRLDLALALGAVAALGGDIERAIGVLPQMTLPEGRYQELELPTGVKAVYDAYNAAPASTEAALHTFAEQAHAARRKVAVLSSMAELGHEAERLHRRVGECAGRLAGERALDALLVGGDFADALEAGALAAGAPPSSIKRFDNNAQATAWLRENLRSGDAVLLKGSRRYKMEEILEGLRR